MQTEKWDQAAIALLLRMSFYRRGNFSLVTQSMSSFIQAYANCLSDNCDAADLTTGTTFGEQLWLVFLCFRDWVASDFDTALTRELLMAQ